MSRPRTPTPPDPVETARAQTDSNVQTAIANATLGNVNQITPDGNVTFTRTPSDITLEGNNVPTITRTVTLSPEQQAIQDQTDAAELNLGRLANQQTSQLYGLLGDPVNTSNVTRRPDAGQLSVPQLNNFQGDAGLQGFSNSPNLGGDIPGQVNLNGEIANAGDITRTYGTDFSTNRDQVVNSIIDRNSAEQSRDLQRLQTRLANQGIEVGSQRYQDELEQYQTGINDFRLGAILAGGQEQSRLAGLENQRSVFENSAQQQQFNQNAQSSDFSNNTALNQFGANLTRSQALDQAAQGNINNQRAVIDQNNSVNQQSLDNFNQAIAQNNNVSQQGFGNEINRNQAINNQRNQELDEIFNTRNQAINENIGLLSGSQVNNPNFAAANQPVIPTTDEAGIRQQDFQNRLGIFQQQQAQQNGIFGGLLGLAGRVGGGLIGLSDENAKENISPVGKLKGHKLYEFNYKGSKQSQIGVMAQEVEKKRPDVVSKRPDGLRQVDYGKLFNIGGKKAA